MKTSASERAFFSPRIFISLGMCLAGIVAANGSRDTGIGFQALSQNTSGVDNTAIGVGALFSNTTGYDNTANGSSALQSNINGFFNTANGNQARFSAIELVTTTPP